MKLLNKILKKFGYRIMSVKEYNVLNSTLKDITNAIIMDRINYIKKVSNYNIVEETDGYMVACECHAVKFYPFNDDKEFAKLLAEELCDKLNERY